MRTEITVPALPIRTGASYLKHGVRASNDLSVVGVAAVVTLEKGGQVVEDLKLVLGAVAPTPIRAQKAETVLRGKQPTEALISEAARIASEETQPIADIRASAEYRREMVSVFTKYAIMNASKEAISS